MGSIKLNIIINKFMYSYIRAKVLNSKEEMSDFIYKVAAILLQRVIFLLHVRFYKNSTSRVTF